MESYKFNSTIKCTGCLEAVKPHLDGVEEISQWQVDLQSPEKTLTVTGGRDIKEKVITAVKKAGFELVKIH